jgi:hypothetical protein
MADYRSTCKTRKYQQLPAAQTADRISKLQQKDEADARTHGYTCTPLCMIPRHFFGDFKKIAMYINGV